MPKFYYTYVLVSQKDKKYYIGFTNNLERRLEEHKLGSVSSTKHRRPLELVYFEACRNEKDVIHREKYFKMGYGRRFLKGRLKNFLSLRFPLSPCSSMDRTPDF